MNANLAAIAYLVSGVLFILALRGLSSPVTSRRGNQMGMIGMAIAVAVTLLTLLEPGRPRRRHPGPDRGRRGHRRHRRRGDRPAGAMTAMPQLVAAFHSLVGLAACLVAVGRRSTPRPPTASPTPAAVKLESLIELSLGVAIGAVTFTGSLIAFAKLNGNMSGAPIMLPAATC